MSSWDAMPLVSRSESKLGRARILARALPLHHGDRTRVAVCIDDDVATAAAACKNQDRENRQCCRSDESSPRVNPEFDGLKKHVVD